ncbi:MAG: Gfo/Idh/MocA family oxidoreductase [Caldilineaceae bacterium]
MTLKIGLIGCGGIMRPHVEGWLAQAGRAEIVAVADVSDENIRTRVQQIGHEVAIYHDYHDLLADPNVDAVDLALPHHLHCESIVAAAKAGKHLMTEKPLCLNLAEAEEIRKAVDESGIIMMAAHNQLFFPAVLQAKQMLINGDLGKIHAIHSYDCDARRGVLPANKNDWGKNTAALSGWRLDEAKMGGGELIDTGYHPTYRLLFLAGQTPVEVASMLGTYRMNMDREDTAYVLAKFADGAIGQIMTSWAIRARRRAYTVPHHGRTVNFGAMSTASITNPSSSRNRPPSNTRTGHRRPPPSPPRSVTLSTPSRAASSPSTPSPKPPTRCV